MTEDRGDDYGLHALAEEFGGYGVADVVQAGVGMQAGLECQSFERARERVRVDEVTVPAVTHEGDGTAVLVEGIAPSGGERKEEAARPDATVSSSKGELSRSFLGATNWLNAPADEDRARLDVDVLP